MAISILDSPVLYSTLLFAALLISMEAGRRLGRYRLSKDPALSDTGTGAVDGAVFALLGLLVAFTFSGAAARFDERRAMIVTEANDIGTAYLRLDLLPASAQPALRDAFSRYVDSRIASFANATDIRSFQEEFRKTKLIQSEIWKSAVEASRRADAAPPASILLLPAINAMIDITSTRATAMLFHPPWPVFAMLMGSALICSLLAGLAMRRSPTPRWAHMIGFSAMMTATMYVIEQVA